MNNLFRGLIAAYGAKKLGGGCFGTVLVFILIWVALGQCGSAFVEQAFTNGIPEIDTYLQQMSDHFRNVKGCVTTAFYSIT